MIKKVALLTCLSLSQVFALDIAEPAFGLWGLGISVKETPFLNQNAQVKINPYIFGGYGVVNIEANRANINVYSTDMGFSFAALAQYRTHQSSVNDTLDDRENSVEVGLQISYPLGLGFTSRLSYLQDISNKHKGNELEFQIYRHDDIGKVAILSSLSLQRESAGLLNYYYGISGTPGSPGYTPEEGLAGEGEVILTYPISSWAIFTGLRYYVYDKEVNNSPLTHSNDILQAFMGLGYKF